MINKRSLKYKILVLFVPITIYLTIKMSEIKNKEIADIEIQGECAKERIENEIIIYPNEKYIFLANIVVPMESPNTDPTVPENGPFIGPTVGITLCTQSSIENLHYIRELAANWNGDISLTVFSYGDQIWTSLHYMLLLHKCYPAVQQHVRFHLVYPISHPPGPYNKTEFYQLECKESKIRNNFKSKNFALSVIYPVNIVRNIAMVYANTPFVFNLDIDFLPSHNLKMEMERFLKLRNEDYLHRNIAYVIPCFETNSTDVFSSKADVLQGFSRGTIRQFTKLKCNKCQLPTDYERWLSLSYPSAMTVGYCAGFNKIYEPFYIAERDRLPGFRAMFKGYGKNRVSQVYEAKVMGFKFAVMNNAFVVHDGFKEISSFTDWKREQHKKNDQLFKQVFLPLMKVLHGNGSDIRT